MVNVVNEISTVSRRSEVRVRPWKTNFAKRTHVSSLELCRSQFGYLQKGTKSKSWLQVYCTALDVEPKNDAP